jgi:hypothetical protein
MYIGEDWHENSRVRLSKHCLLGRVACEAVLSAAKDEAFVDATQKSNNLALSANIFG